MDEPTRKRIVEILFELARLNAELKRLLPEAAPTTVQEHDADAHVWPSQVVSLTPRLRARTRE
jgi:hypothetical protein